MTLRTLLTLKALLLWRSIPPKRRAGVLILVALVAVMLGPPLVGAAMLAYSGVMSLGAPALVVAFAAAQLTWVVVTVIANAFGETFEMRRMLRFPVHPRAVFVAGVVFALAEPAALLVLPELIAVVAAAAIRCGALAGVLAALAFVLLLAITGALLQLVLMLVLDLRRVRWLRLLHEALATTIASGSYLVYLLISERVKPFLQHLRPDVPALVERAAGEVTRWMPTAGWPAQIGAGALAGRWDHALLGLAGALALLVALVEVGWRIGQRAALGRETAAAARPERRGASTAGWRPLRALLPMPVALLVERELALVLRGTQVLSYAIYAVFVVVMFRGVDRDMLTWFGPYLALLLSVQVQAATISLFGGEREGLRLLFMLPLPGRALVLAKDLGVALQFGLTLAITLVSLAVAGAPVLGPYGVELVAWAVSIVLASLLVGNHLSAVHPVRMDGRGRVNSPYRFVSGIAQAAAMLGTMGLLALTRWLARLAAPPGAEAAAGAVAALAALAALLALWWWRLDGAGRTVEANREGMLSTIAVPSESG